MKLPFKRLCVAFVAIMGMSVVGVPIASAQSEPSTLQKVTAQITASPAATVIPLQAQSQIDLSKVVPVNGHKITVEIRDIDGNLIHPNNGGGHKPGEVTGQISVGAGWYLYVYLNQGDYLWLLGLGYTAATAALCVILTPSVLGGVACAVVAYIIWSVITSSPPPAWNACIEVKINWWGTSAGSKFVQRNC
jgi:hypothetical protein